MGDAWQTEKGGRMNYNMTGKEVRRHERERRNRPAEPPMRDWAIPMAIAFALFLIVGVLVDPTSIFTIR